MLTSPPSLLFRPLALTPDPPMNAIIRASLNNPYAITVAILCVFMLGSFAVLQLPIDILPVYRAPAVQVLTFYGGMSATAIDKGITSRMERWTGQAAGMTRQESRSIVGASVVRNYFNPDTPLSEAMTQVSSLSSAAAPYLPPGTLPPVILPFDPTGSTPVCVIALDAEARGEAELYDAGRYEVRNMVMSIRGAVAPVVYGGKNRAIIAYLNREQLQSRGMSPVDVMDGLERYNVFLPTGSMKLGVRDYALESNSMYDVIDDMRELPLKMGTGRPVVLGDVANPKDTSLMQTTVVRVNGRKQVYIPVYRQPGTSTLSVVDELKEQLPGIQGRLTFPDIALKLVMDQSVYVRNAIHSLAEEGILGALLCSLVILLFLGDWRMTLIALVTIPIAVLAAMMGLYFTGQTINVMTLAGLALAIGPLVDAAIIVLENTHRHLGHQNISARLASYKGAGEVALPGLVATLCTLLVLAPLAFVPGLGPFLFKPLALAVTFAIVAAYVVSMTFVPVLSSLWLAPHPHGHTPEPTVNPILLAYRWWDGLLSGAISWYAASLASVLRSRWAVCGLALLLFVGVVIGLGGRLRREFFPEVDAGAFEVAVRAPTGLRLEVTVERVSEVEQAIREVVGDDLELIISETGVTPDWSAAYTPNAGPMDAVIKVQLSTHRHHTAQQHVKELRAALNGEPAFTGLEFAFDTGGMIRGAMNEGKSTPLNLQILGKDIALSRLIAERIQADLKEVRGVVDCRVIQRLDYPQYVIDVDKTKAASLGLTQGEVMRNVVAAFNSSIQFNKKNFWIDPVSSNQYYVGVQYPEADIKSLETMLQVPITGAAQKSPIPLGNLVTLRRRTVPAEQSHTNLQSAVDVTMNIQGRDLGHVADDVWRVLASHGEALPSGGWAPYDPRGDVPTPLKGVKMTLSGEYSRMNDMFRNLGLGLVVAALLVYFLMVALFRSWLVPTVILSAVPLGLIGVVLVLFVTRTAINVQSLLGVIFMVGIVVSNTVLLIDFAQTLRKQDGLTPTGAILEAAKVRVKPVMMTALAAFFALLPMALGFAHGSEANAPLGRAVLGGLVAGVLTTLVVVPCLYSLLLPDAPGMPATAEEIEPLA